MTPPAGTVIIGLGNVILTDDGLGVHALQRLRERDGPADDVQLIEGGTAGLLLLPYLADAERVILIDAIDIGAPPGSLVRLEGGEWAQAFALHMSPHDIGLADLLGAAEVSGAWPDALVIHGVQPGSTGFGTELTACVAEAVSSLVDAITTELAGWSEVHRRRRCSRLGIPRTGDCSDVAIVGGGAHTV
jgi:hydrogenase maturation protease